MKITINDIAKAANVAKSTVSKVLNDAPSISEETKRRVRQVMSEMNYTPSSIATQLARKSSFNVGLLVDMSRRDDFLNYFFYNIIGGVESVIGPLGYELTICNYHSHDNLQLMNRFVFNKRVDGFILDNSLLTKQMAVTFNEAGFPFISIGELPGFTDMSWVDIDNQRGGELITEHLIFQGYGRCAFVGGEANEPIFSKRLTGFTEALAKYGKPFVNEYIKPGYANEVNGYKLMRELLSLETPPNAVVCINNYTAFGALKAIHEHKLKVPDEIGIVTFDQFPLAAYTSPPLTSLNIDTFELGVTAATMLMQRIHGMERSWETKRMQPQLIIRESTRRKS
ncbi:LacI family DNA-binding transcriptional regulator [Paenibacillus sedimenti]|uniref:LacI family DNA-binding transcriptional regulator n=1 Tax=Paenibacillus sedimenti TaxID=2770274 RepID=A0A926KQ06_9BACL|nr:LacI family DNA-binding transcriptional regulator [Paenibacillus sedimenti]MBD0380000.1 LacI family DNA-binding transcriptional regulator [Paenibacillus sedimenti]